MSEDKLLSLVGFSDLNQLAEELQQPRENIERVASISSEIFSTLVEGAALSKRLKEEIKTNAPFRDIVSVIHKNVKIGDFLLSERNMEIETGHSRPIIREQLFKLEAFGFVSIQHGKPTKLLRQFAQKYTNLLP